MRIFIGLTEVSGYYSNLKKGFDELGIPTAYVSLYAHPFNYGGVEERWWLPRVARYCVQERISRLRASLPVRVFWLVAVSVSRILLFFWALWRFDAFIMGGGSSFFQFREFPILRLFGKRIVYMFHGTDSRPGYMDGFCEDVPRLTSRSFEDLYCDRFQDAAANEEVLLRLLGYQQATRRRKTNVARVEQYADVSVNHPAHGHFHTCSFVPSVIVGLPYQFKAVPPSVRDERREGVRVLHSPSHPEGKGTAYIRAAIEKAKSNGVAIDYVELTGRPNAEVLAELQRCDFVVDQAFSDYPMAAFAMEAAFFAKPAIVGGYYADRIEKDIPREYIPPTLFCHPDQLAAAIIKLATDVPFRMDLGARAQAFVERRWIAREVAGRYLKLLEGSFPRDWVFRPDQIEYVQGMGQPEARTKAVVRALVEHHGRSALCLDHRPALEQRVLDFAFDTKTAASMT